MILMIGGLVVTSCVKEKMTKNEKYENIKQKVDKCIIIFKIIDKRYLHAHGHVTQNIIVNFH